MKKLLFYLLAAGALFSGACSKPEGPTIKVISYNVRQAGIDDGENNWELRKPATLRMITLEKPDLLGIQEGLIDQVHYIEENCPHYNRLGVGRDNGIDEGEMMAIFYLHDRLYLEENGTFWLSETPDTVSLGWDAACRRTATWALFSDKVSGKEICYINTHLDHMGPTAREESVKLLVKKIREIAPADAAVVLGGDFNSTTDDAIFRPLDILLLSARDLSPMTDRKATFSDYGHADSTELLDHLFFANLKPVSFRTLDGNYGVPYISDHYPIEAVLRY